MEPEKINKIGKRILLFAAIVAALLFIPTDCSCDGGKKDVVVPEIKGTLSPAKPESNPIISTEPIFVSTGVKSSTSRKEAEYWKAEANRLLVSKTKKATSLEPATKR